MAKRKCSTARRRAKKRQAKLVANYGYFTAEYLKSEKSLQEKLPVEEPYRPLNPSEFKQPIPVYTPTPIDLLNEVILNKEENLGTLEFRRTIKIHDLDEISRKDIYIERIKLFLCNDCLVNKVKTECYLCFNNFYTKQEPNHLLDQVKIRTRLREKEKLAKEFFEKNLKLGIFFDVLRNEDKIKIINEQKNLYLCENCKKKSRANINCEKCYKNVFNKVKINNFSQTRINLWLERSKDEIKKSSIDELGRDIVIIKDDEKKEKFIEALDIKKYVSDRRTVIKSKKNKPKKRL